MLLMGGYGSIRVIRLSPVFRQLSGAHEVEAIQGATDSTCTGPFLKSTDSPSGRSATWGGC